MQVLYCDNHVLVAYKPAGLPTQADDSGDPDLLTLARQWIGHKYAKPGQVFAGLVHRLDRPARGLVAIARTSKGAARLSEQFRARSVTKIYEVVVRGRPAPASGSLSDWLVSDERGSRIAAPGQGVLATLDYQVRDQHGELTLLEVALHSGRKHQIRVQLASRGWPVLGDLRYGAREPLPDRSIALLARRLEFDHPTTRERLVFVAADPPGWPWRPDERG